MTTSEPSRASPVRAAVGIRRALTSILLAVVLALLVWVVAVPLLGVELTVGTGGVGQAIGAPMVLGASLVAGLAGWGVSVLLDRFAPRPRTMWFVVAGIVALLSLAGPLTSGVATGGMASLALMHVLVAGVLIPGLAPGSRAR